MPAILLVPTALSAMGTQLCKSLEIRDTTASTKYPIANPHQGKFRAEVSRYLSNSHYTGNSSKAWYLLADPADLPVIEVAFLNGQESPDHRDGRGRLHGAGHPDAWLPRLRRGPAGSPRRREEQGRGVSLDVDRDEVTGISTHRRTTMAATFVHDGESIDYTPGRRRGRRRRGGPGRPGGRGQAAAIAANLLGSLAVEGVFDVPKASGAGTAIAAGASVYWNAAAKQATTTASGNKLMGKTVRAAVDADTTVRVRLSQ